MPTNPIRKFLGLKPISKSWKKISIKGFSNYIFYLSPKNTIEKYVVSEIVNFGFKKVFHFEENDCFVQLNTDGEAITKKGASIKISKFPFKKSNKISIFVLDDNLQVINNENNLVFINEYDCEISSKKDITQILKNRIRNLSDFELKELKIFKERIKPFRLKSKHGDIFRIPLKNSMYLYGRVITPLRKLIKYKIPHIGDFDFNDMSVNVFDYDFFSFPVWVDFYKIKTSNPYITTEELKKYRTTPSIIIGDYYFRHKIFEIIGNVDILLESFDVPMEVGTKYQDEPYCHFFNWGLGIIKFKPNKKLESLISNTEYQGRNYRTNKKYELFIDNNINEEDDFASLSRFGDLRDSFHIEKRKIISKMIRFDIEKSSYDDFAKKFNFKTKKEILELCKK